jgi:HD-GYP domain-containing protein (c-di-GMP phosphodiesterase class II)
MSLTLQTARPKRQHSVCNHDRLYVQGLEEQIFQLRNSTVFALNEMLDLKDIYTGMHSTRLAEWAVRVGELMEMSDSDLRDLETGAILHDIGKNGVPEYILNKPAALDLNERKQVEKHSEYGWGILRSIPGFEKTSLLVLHHHERIDGKGYPSQLSNADIPLGSRVIAIIDSFDAMVSDRPYRKGLSIDEAMRRLTAGSRTQFDADIVAIFRRIAEHDFADVHDLDGLEPPLNSFLSLSTKSAEIRKTES